MNTDTTEYRWKITNFKSNLSYVVLFNFTDNTTIEDPRGTCEDWKEAQHALFQLANLCLIVSFLTPSNFQHHAFCVRLILGLGYLFFSLWSGLIVCMPDVLGWNVGFFIINMVYVCYLGYKLMPIRFISELDDLYIKVFKPLRITRKQYKQLLSIGSVYVLTKNNIYAKEGITSTGEKTSILIKGRLKVLYDNLFLHYVNTNQFVDSPEYDSVSSTGTLATDEHYQVTIIASEDSLLLTWSYVELRQYLESEPCLGAIFHHLVGKDISNKLYQIQELLMHNPNYMQSYSSRQSSIVNLRSAIVSHNSISSFTKLNCFGIDLKGWGLQSLSRSGVNYRTHTFESQV